MATYIRSRVVFLLFIPAKHELMTICAVLHCCLVHRTECSSILKDLLAGVLRMHRNNGPGCRTLEIVLLDHAIALKDLLYGLRRVER